jgi:hypothetical protein
MNRTETQGIQYIYIYFREIEVLNNITRFLFQGKKKLSSSFIAIEYYCLHVRYLIIKLSFNIFSDHK